jgi:perosamine synthetase
MNESKNWLPVAEPDIGELEEQYLLRAFRSGWISSLGEYVDTFEKSFAGFCEAEYGVAVSSGTVALQLALLAAKIGPGDEVIIPPLTFVATATAVKYVGATPVFVDCEPDIGTMSYSALEKAITPRTRCVIPVHLYGHPADMDPIMELANKYNLLVIEDAAEAHGARYKGRKVGSIGHMGIFSFYGNKLITTGEGGMVVTDNPEFVSRIRLLKNHAMSPTRRYWHQEIGFNFRMTNLQAAIGCAQLERFDEIIGKHRAVLGMYREAFAGAYGISLNPSKPWAEPVPWLVCALLPDKFAGAKRDALMSMLQSEAIDTRPYFNLLCDMPPYRDDSANTGSDNHCSAARQLAMRGLNLPSSSTLTRENIFRVDDVLRKALHDLARE